MTQAFARIGGHKITHATVRVGNVGPWVATCDLEGAADGLSGRVVLELGALRLSGTVDPTASGTHALQRRVRIVAGGGGWAREVGPRAYHNDLSVKARAVAEDVAREAGETLGVLVPTAERVGVDYVRRVGPASRALEGVLGGAPWWVDYDGVTHAGPRPPTSLEASAYEVLAYEPRERTATLAVDDLRAVRIGSVLSARLDAPQTVRELELQVTPDAVRVQAWCGGGEAAPGQLAGLLAAIARRATDGRLYGAYRYRVVQMAGERVELQAVRQGAGLPDVLPISQWPGVPGADPVLAPGGLVLVQFLEGDPTQPVITGYGGPGQPGFAATLLTLGGEGGQPVARQGDAVEVLLPPAIFSGTIGGLPATGVLTFPMMKMTGTVTGGSGRVRVA